MSRRRSRTKGSARQTSLPTTICSTATICAKPYLTVKARGRQCEPSIWRESLMCSRYSRHTGCARRSAPRPSKARSQSTLPTGINKTTEWRSRFWQPTRRATIKNFRIVQRGAAPLYLFYSIESERWRPTRRQSPARASASLLPGVKQQYPPNMDAVLPTPCANALRRC